MTGLEFLCLFWLLVLMLMSMLLAHKVDRVRGDRDFYKSWVRTQEKLISEQDNQIQIQKELITDLENYTKALEVELSRAKVDKGE